MLFPIRGKQVCRPRGVPQTWGTPPRWAWRVAGEGGGKTLDEIGQIPFSFHARQSLNGMCMLRFRAILGRIASRPCSQKQYDNADPEHDETRIGSFKPGRWSLIGVEATSDSPPSPRLATIMGRGLAAAVIAIQEWDKLFLLGTLAKGPAKMCSANFQKL
jgi:hypothetical protein